MVWKVVLLDDHALVRAGARGVIAGDPRYEIVAECDTGTSALDAIERFQPDIALVDLGLPDIPGVEVIQEMGLRAPECRAIVLSQHREPHFVETAIRAGAAGYVLKDDPPEELVRCLHRVAGGGSHVSSSIASQVVRSTALLSSREREVVTLISEGLSSKEIASSLGIAARTVDAHRSRVMSKLGIHKITGLVRYAIREGYISA